MIGLFIGSFNPITKAHIEICDKLKDRFEKIILVPVNSNDKHLVSLKDRIEMLKIIVRKKSYLEISNIMKNYSYLNYRIIDLLNDQYKNINIIMGSDLLEKFDKFDNYNYLLEKYMFTIVPRDNIDVKKIINNKYQDYLDKFSILDYHSDISSTMAKECLKNNLDTKDILDEDILNYIKEHNLY